MPRVVEKVTDEATELVRTKARAWLDAHGFADARLDIYRKIPGHSIRVRVVHPRFTDQLIEDRDRMTSGLLRDVPDEIDQDITLVLLLGPDELEGDFANAEFDRPASSYLGTLE